MYEIMSGGVRGRGSNPPTYSIYKFTGLMNFYLIPLPVAIGTFLPREGVTK
jgi:hypothetical protein